MWEGAHMAVAGWRALSTGGTIQERQVRFDVVAVDRREGAGGRRWEVRREVYESKAWKR